VTAEREKLGREAGFCYTGLAQAAIVHDRYLAEKPSNELVTSYLVEALEQLDSAYLYFDPVIEPEFVVSLTNWAARIHTSIEGWMARLEDRSRILRFEMLRHDEREKYAELSGISQASRADTDKRLDRLLYMPQSPYAIFKYVSERVKMFVWSSELTEFLNHVRDDRGCEKIDRSSFPGASEATS
jgi:hypothetical protein